ncbi:hypothetical protein [Pseudomonas sp. MRSN 12121]|uniref:hypothetical protein n=1 Tax=Pseudomonas sp. MRSN 12121 TaxID=1611770 RepID=UPI00210DFAD9|nr:hypothetical protein [Pseudomonas sp. MRSN 12121]
MLQNDGLAVKAADLTPWRSRRAASSPDWTGLALDDSQLTDLPAYTKKMNDITREEFNAKLETIEARMDARVESVSSKIDAFLATQSAVQIERDKAQAERDKRFEILAERATKAAEGAEEAAKQSATVKANYWAAVAVQLLAVVAILVGAYYANQANVFGAMQTTMSAYQAGKESTKAAEASPSSLPK